MGGGSPRRSQALIERDPCQGEPRCFRVFAAPRQTELIMKCTEGSWRKEVKHGTGKSWDEPVMVDWNLGLMVNFFLICVNFIS